MDIYTYITNSLKLLFDNSIEYLDEAHHTFPTDLVEIPDDDSIAELAYFAAMAEGEFDHE